jgi:hypothetical protein
LFVDLGGVVSNQIYAADLLQHLLDVGEDDAVEMAVWARGEEVFEDEL